MKPGTIVVCLPHEVSTPAGIIKWLPQMDEKTPYMIRQFLPKEEVIDQSDDGVYFEEGVIGELYGNEIAFPARYVREILPADEIPEEIKERVEEPMYA